MLRLGFDVDSRGFVYGVGKQRWSSRKVGPSFGKGKNVKNRECSFGLHRDRARGGMVPRAQCCSAERSNLVSIGLTGSPSLLWVGAARAGLRGIGTHGLRSILRHLSQPAAEDGRTDARYDEHRA